MFTKVATFLTNQPNGPKQSLEYQIFYSVNSKGINVHITNFFPQSREEVVLQK